MMTSAEDVWTWAAGLWQATTWSAIDARAHRVAAELPGGAPIMVLGESSAELLVAIKAAWALGSPVVIPAVQPGPGGCRPTAEIVRLVEQLGVGALITTGLAGDALDGVPDSLPVMIVPADEPKAGTGGSPIEVPEGPATIAFQATSGTTGAQKLLPITGSMLAANLDAVAGQLDLGPDDRVASWLPLYHDMGLFGLGAVAMRYRCPIALVPNAAFARSPLLWFEAVGLVDATLTASAPLGLDLASKRLSTVDRTFDLSSIRNLVVGADRLDASVIDRFVAVASPHGLRRSAVVTAYGMAEATLAVSLGRLASESEPTEVRDGVYHSGTPLPGVDVTVDDAARGQDAEFRVRGTSVARHQILDGVSTALADPSGWLATGDLGELDDGRLRVLGRRSDRIVIGGSNVDPAYLEARLHEMIGSDARELAVSSMAIQGREQIIVVARLHASTTPSSCVEIGQDLRRHAFSLTGHQAKVVFTSDRLPRTSSGKVRRRDLAAIAARETLAGVVPG